MPEFDFGFGGGTARSAAPSEPVNNGDNQPVAPTSEPEDINDVKPGSSPVRDGDNKIVEPATTTEPTQTTEPTTNDDKLEEGTVIELEDAKYTVDKDGNLVDDKGEIFKQAAEVKDFLAEFEQDNPDNDFTIENIQKRIGIEITDEDDKPVTFDNTPDGVAAYVDAVIDQQKDELALAGINKLIETYPFVQDVINYYVANGGSLEGFGQVRDLSKIEIDENNVAQQEAIIRQAHREAGRRDSADKYVQYLKDSGQLFDTAKEALKAMVDADNAERERTAKEAATRQKEYEAQQAAYWKDIQDTIKNRRIAGYEIPETIILNKDGKKVAVTPNDFFNYVYQVDEKGNSRYVNDLAQMTPEERRDDELLRAYLKYTGGSYADLVNMAIKKEEVKRLKLKAVANNKQRVTVTPPARSTTKPSDTNFGY